MEFIASCPLYVDGQVFIINKFSITSLNAETGKENWSFFTGDELYTSLSYADSKIYMMTSQRHIFILDAATNGTKLATYETHSGSWSSPSIANGRLYIGNHDWNVYCFAPTVTAPTVTPPPENVFTSPQYLAIFVVLIAALVALIVTLYFFSKRLKRGDRQSPTVSSPSLKRQ